MIITFVKHTKINYYICYRLTHVTLNYIVHNLFATLSIPLRAKVLEMSPRPVTGVKGTLNFCVSKRNIFNIYCTTLSKEH